MGIQVLAVIVATRVAVGAPRVPREGGRAKQYRQSPGGHLPAQKGVIICGGILEVARDTTASLTAVIHSNTVPVGLVANSTPWKGMGDVVQ